MSNKRIAVFIYGDRDINTYPSVTNTIRLLVESGYLVDVFLPLMMKTSLNIQNTNFIVVSKQHTSHYVTNTIDYIHNNTQYDFIFSYTIEGLIISYLINLFPIN